MAIHNTTRLALRYPDLAEPADVPAYIQDLASDTDAVVAGFKQGTHALRPAASAAYEGWFYWETDTVALFYCDSAVWQSVGSIPDGSITSAKIADGTIADVDLAADTLTARVIAANAITASELADNAVDTAAILASAVTTAKLDQTGAFNFSAAGGLKAQSMRVHRHPYANDRHIESGTVTGTDAGSGASGSASFTDAFASAPNIAACGQGPGDVIGITPSTTGFSWSGSFGASQTRTTMWIAEGSD